MKFTCDCVTYKNYTLSDISDLFSAYSENYCDSEIDAICQSIEKAETICNDSNSYELQIAIFDDDSDPIADTPIKEITIPIPYDITVRYNSPCGWYSGRFQTIEDAIAYRDELQKDGYKADIVFEPAT